MLAHTRLLKNKQQYLLLALSVMKRNHMAYV